MRKTSLEICDKSSGSIWPRLHACSSKEEQLPSSDESGCVVRISSKVTWASDRFQYASFGCSIAGEVVACSQSRVFYFNLKANRFNVVASLHEEPCSLAWNKAIEGFALIGLASGTILYCSIGLLKVLAELHGHCRGPENIVLHPLSHLAASNSDDEALLWDLKKRTVKHKLAIKRDVQLVKVLFYGIDKLLTAFRDNSIFIWDLDALSPLKHFAPQCSISWHYRTVALVGDLLLAAGSASIIHIWDLETMCFRRQVDLPESVEGVQQLVGWSKAIQNVEHWMVALMTGKGRICVVDLAAAQIVYDFNGLDSTVKAISSSLNGNYMAVVLHSGILDVYSLKQGEFKQPRSDSQDAASSREALRAGEDVFIGKVMEIQLPRLRVLLTKFGEYPTRHRRTVWKCVLRLPENETAYHLLEAKGIHRSCCHLNHHVLLKAETLQLKLQKLLSALAYLSPTLAGVDYLPLLVFPFVKVFPDSHLLCFEVVLTILANWCQHWFENYPRPPLPILSLVENLLALHDADLLQHFIKKGITAEIYAWPLLQTAFSEVFMKTEWLRLWDHLLSNRPSFILCVVAAYNRICRQILLAYSEIQQFQLFFHRPAGFDVSSVLEEAIRIDNNTPDNMHPHCHMQEFVPLNEGEYIDPVSQMKLEHSKRIEAEMPGVNTQKEPLSTSTQGFSPSSACIIPETLELRWRLAHSTYRRASQKKVY